MTLPPGPASDAAVAAAPPPDGAVAPDADADAAAAPPPRDEIGAAARSGVLNLAGAGFSAVAGLLLTLVVTRLFSPEVAGVFFVAMTVFLIASTVAGLGSGVGAVYLLARRRALGEVTGLRAVFQVATGPAVIASAVTAAAVWFIAPWLAPRMIPDAAAAAIVALRVAAVFVPAAVVLNLFVSAIRGLGRTRPFVVIERLTRPSLQLLAVAAVGLAVATGAGAVTAAWAAPYLVAAAAAVVWAVRLRRRLERAAGVVEPAAPTRSDWTTFWRFAAPRGGTGVAQIAMQRLDVVLIVALLGPVEVALYVVASRFLVVGQFANQAVGFATQHRFAALLAKEDIAGARRLYQTTTGWLMVGTWPFFLLCIVFAGPILSVFGPQYLDAAPVLRVLSAVMLLASACGMVSMVLEMAGRSLSVLVQTLIALTANVVLNLILIPRIGLVGAAYAWAGAIALNNLVPFAQLYRGYRLQPIGRGAAIAMAAAVGCFGIPAGAALVLFGAPAAVLATVVGGFGYVLVLWRARHALELTALMALRRNAR